jgi:hypothetical protein
MNDSKLIEFLKSFSKEEYRELQKFSGSSYISKGRKYNELLVSLKRYFPDFNNNKLTKKFLYKSVFPGKTYNDQVMRNLINGLTRICEQFIVCRRIINDKGEYYNILADETLKRKLIDISENNLHKSEATNGLDGLDTNFYKKQYESEQTKREVYNLKYGQKESIEILSKASTDFIYFFVLEISSQLEEMIVLNHNWNAGFESKLTYEILKNFNLDNILKFLKDNSYENYGLIELYVCHIKQMINFRNEELFESLKDKFKKYSALLSRWGKYNMYLALANACIRLQEINETKYTIELLELYKEQLDNNLYTAYSGTAMEQDLFRNIFINALKLKQFDWAENYLRRYLPELQPEYIENMKNFSYSNLYFEKRNFETALKYISQVKYDTFVFKFDVRALMLKIYYEMEYYEQARFLIDSFRHFIIENTSITEYIKMVHLNFIKFVNEIIRLNESKKEFDSKRIINEISLSPARNKEWLIEKVEELSP